MGEKTRKREVCILYIEKTENFSKKVLTRGEGCDIITELEKYLHFYGGNYVHIHGKSQ